MLIFNIIFKQTLPIMLALYLMLLATYYAQNYAGIIGWSLILTAPIYMLITVYNDNFKFKLS